MESLGIIEMLEWYVVGFCDIRVAPFNIETKYFEGERKETGTSRFIIQNQ